MAAPSFVNVSSRANQGFGESLTPNAPASMVAGNLLVIVAFAPSSNVTPFSVPAPWTIVEQSGEGGAASMSMMVAVALCTSSAMSMPSITWGSNTSVNAYVLQYTGNTSFATNGAFNESDSGGVASGTATNPGLNTTEPNSLVVNILVGAAASPSGTPSGYSIEVAATTDHMQVSDITEVTSGSATPAVSQAMASSTAWTVMQLEVLSTAPPVANTKRSVSVNVGL